jgi:peroxiredoxin
MVALETPSVELGWQAKDFSLPAVDGKHYTLSDVMGERGLWLMFICNHCPYVQRQTALISQTANKLQAAGIGVAAISSNDAQHYPEDSFENMKLFAAQEGFAFPYLYDESQEVARSYDAVCTPDFFGFAADGTLQYRGRLLDDAGNAELLPAMLEIAQNGKTDVPQHPSVGCSIKWK